jgi:hypothetical protein
MEARLPIQLVTEYLWEDRRDNEDPATRAWNLAVALFYEAGGIPWRADMRVDEACFVGVSFHHLRTQQQHVVYSSLAQAFSSDGEGCALRGEAVPYDEERWRRRMRPVLAQPRVRVRRFRALGSRRSSRIPRWFSSVARNRRATCASGTPVSTRPTWLRGF